MDAKEAVKHSYKSAANAAAFAELAIEKAPVDETPVERLLLAGMALQIATLAELHAQRMCWEDYTGKNHRDS